MTAPDPRVDAAQRWLGTSRQRLDAGAVDEALAAARSGIAELGNDYAGPDVDDDTELKALAAEDQLEQGNPAAAATLLQRVLESRIAMVASAAGR